MQTGALVEIPRRRLARATGGIYLAFVACLFLADTLGHIVVGDVDLAYEILATDPSRFDLAVTFALLSAFLFAVAAWGLSVLLRPVNRELSLLLLLLNAIGVAIQVAGYTPLLFARLSADTTGFVDSFSAAQNEGLLRVSFDVQKLSFVTAQLFFATWLFPLGYLVYKSGFLPRFLGALLLFDGLAILIWFFQGMLLPDQTALSTPGLALSFIAEVALGLWLLVRSIDDSPGT